MAARQVTRRNGAAATQGLTLLLAVTLMVSGCSVPLGDLGEAMGGTPEEATRIVEDWIAEARSGEDDLGWSRLYPFVRDEIFGSYEVYEDAVLASDWSRFDYLVHDVRPHDGRYRIEIRVPGGSEATPAFMVDWGIVQFVGGDDGIVSVRIPPLGGDRGIQALGGPG